ncbi:HAMP domain-containing protein [Cytobacillus suaedae]|nr:HAMP domain-containing protein [Cytobacillus suaedae]
MKSSLKSRLIIAFLSIIIVPLLTVFISLYIGSVYLERGGEDELDQLFTEVKQEIIKNESVLPNTELFYTNIKPLLERYDINLVISTESDVLLFDSKMYSPADNMRDLPININAFEVKIQPKINEVWTAEIEANSYDREPFNVLRNILYVLFISVGLGILVMLILIVVWTWYISRTILLPLKTIYQATEEMREGNMDFPIHYKRRDELGRFIEGFNLMRQNLKDAFIKQRQSEDARKELIASISHDLRTPLSSIKGYVEGLRDGIVQNEEMKSRYLKVIYEKTDHLDKLIEDLFRYSKMEAEKLPINKELIPTGEYFEELFEGYQFDLKNRGVSLSYTLQISAAEILIDPIRIEQVFSNLIENAVRFGGDQIRIEVQADHINNLVVIRVKDNGQGIDPNDLPHIFNPFYRGEKSRSTKLGNSGLGLAIVKYIVNGHDGNISVESENGEGSVFVFTIGL